MKNKKLVVALVAVVVVIGLMLGVWTATRPATEEGAKACLVSVVHSDGTTHDFFCHTDAEYLDELLLAEGIASGEEGPYGLTIITVDGEDAVWETDSAYWAIYIGEEAAITGASEIPVYDGSSFKLEYTSLG